MAGDHDTQHDTSVALMASTELNRRIVEAMPGGLVHVASDGAILAANAEAVRILGLAYDALTRRYTQDFDTETIWEDGSPCPASDYPVTRALLTGKPQPRATIGVRRPDGQVSWAVFTAVPILDPASGAVSSVVVTFLDVTESKRREELVRSVLTSAPNPIATADRNGKLLSLSKGPLDAQAQVLGLPAWHHLVPEDQPRAQDAIARVVATGIPESYEARGSSGIRWLVHVGPRSEAGECVGVTFVATDVTSHRELEARVAIADRLASVGLLAAGVAHEVNNPLTYLLANLERLDRDTAERSAEERGRIAAALDAGQRIRAIVADLRAFSSMDEGRPALVEVPEVIETALRLAQGEIRSRARVRTSYGRTPPVLANEGRLCQVFLNIIINAAQAIPEGDVEHNEIAVATGADDDGNVVVEIADTGVGIAPTLLERVFDPFVTTKPRGVGTGLGLYVCRNVVTALGGELGVESEPGKRTRLRVVLPAADEALRTTAASRPHPPQPNPKPPARRMRVAVIDDETLIASVIRDFLEDHDVEIAHTGREAIALLSRAEFDVVFCDLVMPDLTGMDLYEHIRTHQPGREAALVFMSGGAFTARTRAFLAEVPNEVLDKPFRLEEIARVVAKRAR